MSDLRAQLQAALGGTYILERELAGGMSRVFVAEETALGRKVVLKVLPPEMLGGVSIDRFRREIALAANLQHAHIVPLLSAGDAGGLPWFTMPYVDGESLRARLGRGELPMADAVRTLRDIAVALAYAHRHGIVHRDIKPENVLLSGGSAMVSDFGIAKALVTAGGGTLTATGVSLGTPQYMAPEQAAADPRTDHRADIYAFGVLAYELLAGHSPFAGRSPQATLAAQMTEAPTAIDHIRSATPPALSALVMRCLAKSPADRPQSAEEIVNALDALVTPVGTTAPQGVAGAGPRTARRRAAIVAAVLLVAAGGAWLALARAHGSALNPRRVAVAPCENLTRDTALAQVGRIAADWITQGIAQTDSVDVVSGTTVAMLVSEARGSQADVVRTLAAATHAGTVITCNVSQIGDSLRVQASLIDARTGSVKRALDPGVGPVSDPLAAVSALRERVLGSLVSGDLTRRVSVGQPPKYSAYRAYMEGLERFYRYQDFRGARPYLLRAIALDSTFALAYAYLGTSYQNLGQWDSAAVIVARTDSLRDQFAPSDRLMLAWEHAVLAGDVAECLRLAQLESNQDPQSGWGYLVGFHATHLLRPAQALAALNESDSASVATGWWNALIVTAAADHELGDYRAELATLAHGRALFPNAALLANRELGAYAGLRQPAKALALADTLLRSVADPNVTIGIEAVAAGAQEFRAHGDSATARSLTALALNWVRAHPSPKSTNGRQEREAAIWLLNGQLDSARTHLLGAAGDTTTIGNGGLLGIIAAQQGNHPRALAIADSIGALNRKWTFGSDSYWRAAILAALGQKDEAMVLLKQAVLQGQDMRNLHAAAEFAPLRGYPPFEELIRPKG